MAKHQVTTDLFRELRKMLPELPEHCTSIDLSLDRNSLPLLKVCFYPDGSKRGPDDEDHKRFVIRELMPGQSQAGAVAAPPPTAASSN